MSSLVIGSRYNGPAASANGGYTAGLVAQQLAGAAVEVTLRRPPPLETPMRLTAENDLLDGGHLVAQARPTDDGFETLPVVGLDEAEHAASRYPGLRGHPFPTCFSCGPERGEGDGLRIFPGPVDESDRGLVAAVWRVRDEPDLAVTWSALDCVGGWSQDLEGRPCVLGRMAARVDVLPRPGTSYVVVGRHLATEGRKTRTASTLLDAGGEVLAVARHTWIQVDPAAFNQPATPAGV